MSANIHEPTAPGAPDNQKQILESKASSYSELLKPDANATRNSWLQSFAKYTRIGELYGDSGNKICEGKSPMAWVLELQVLNPANPLLKPTHEQLLELYMKLAYSYNRASGFYANFMSAAAVLKNILDKAEAKFIEEELAKYKPGGEYWNKDTNRAGTRTPAKPVIEKMARDHCAALHDQLTMYDMTAKFFQVIMANLEYQRRCLKDYSEILSHDPSNHWSGFKG
jgi:hypothetical protein